MKVTPEILKSDRFGFDDPLRTSSYIILEELLNRQYDVEMPYWPVRIARFTTRDGGARTILGVDNQNTPVLARLMSSNKYATYGLAVSLGLPVPDTEIYETPEKAGDFWDRHSGKCIIKPVSGYGGHGVHMTFSGKEEFLGIAARKAGHTYVLLQEKSLADVEVRLLFIGNELAAATARKPFYVIGDGKSTITELLTAENKSRVRRNTHYHPTMVLTQFDPEKVSKRIRRNPDDVLASGERLQASPANTSDGGIAEGVTDSVHTDFVIAATKVAKALNCPVLAVDFLCSDPTVSFSSNMHTPLFLETNTRPGMGQLQYPNIGIGRNVASRYVDYVIENCSK